MDNWNLNLIKNNWAYKNKTETFIFFLVKTLEGENAGKYLLLHPFILVHYYINRMFFSLKGVRNWSFISRVAGLNPGKGHIVECH